MKRAYHGLGLSLALLLGTAAGCVADPGGSGSGPDWVLSGERAYAGRDYRTAVAELSRYVNTYPRGPETGRARYVRALAYARTNARAHAYADLSHATRDDAREVRWRSNVLLGTLCFEDGRWSDAATAYGAAAREMRAAPPMDNVLWRLGQSLERAGRWTEARGAFERLAREFPRSQLADGARRRLELRPTHFAVQAGVFTQASSADRLADQLSQKGLAAYVRREPRRGVLVNVVLVGNHASYEAAWQQATTVRHYVSNAVIWP